VLVLGGFDCLEVPRLQGTGNLPHVWGVMLPGRSSGFVVFTTEDRKVGRPPRFGVVERPGHRRVLLQENNETIERLGQACIQLWWGGGYGGGGNFEVLDNRGESLPVCVRPSWA